MNVDNAFNMVICEHFKDRPLQLSIYKTLERTHELQGGEREYL